MSERPILFSAPMVRAILAGTKSQTRRAVKPQPDVVSTDGTPGRFTPDDARKGRIAEVIACPYGQPGDRLWVREGFCTCYNGQEVYQIIYASGDRRDFSYGSGATEGQLDWLERSMTTHGERGRPSIHLPRWASRITLEVVAVRVERVQDISREDEIAEGAPDGMFYDALWSQINGAASWDANPWVWVVEFRRVAQ